MKNKNNYGKVHDRIHEHKKILLKSDVKDFNFKDTFDSMLQDLVYLFLGNDKND